MCVCVCVYIYIYIYIEREREAVTCLLGRSVRGATSVALIVSGSSS